MKPLVKIAFASGTEDLNTRLVERMRALYPELPLLVVSEFAPPDGEWIPYHVTRSMADNMARCRATLAGKRVRLAGVLLMPKVPYRRMRLMALLLSPAGFLAFNENLDSFMLRPRCLPAIARHVVWRIGNFLRWQLNPGGTLHRWAWRTRHPAEWRLPVLYKTAVLTGAVMGAVKAAALHLGRPVPALTESLPAGISVVIPSRSGRRLLECVLPGVMRDLEGVASEVIVVDNGSDDGTADFLSRAYPHVIVERTAQPLSFARAVNLGIRRARYSHVCLLNNDMIVEPGFFAALRRAFDTVPDLFSATAQILFPPGVRREETGKAVMPEVGPTDFPVRCEVPVAGENLSYVLYGSGGCTLFDTAKLRALDSIGEMYEPAYVEDLDAGYRAWQRGWPTVFVAGARVEHKHRATTSRYYSEDELARILEINYLRFLARAVASPALFRRLWAGAVYRLRLMKSAEPLSFATRALFSIERPPQPALPEERVLALCSGAVAVFPGRAASAGPVVLVASPYLPFPLSHGGAVRMYNLIGLAARDYTQVLVAFADHLDTPPPELLDICAEIVLVRRRGSHSRPSTPRPDVVEEFDSPAFHAAIHQTVSKWRPQIAQLEFTQMAQYAPRCGDAATLLVEHDITLDLYGQLLREREDWEVRGQYERWQRFERAAWREVSRVITMSEKDRSAVVGGRAVVIPNGVDLARFRPSGREPEPRRLLFIGSFAHLPNLMAVEFFLRETWPLLQSFGPVLHIVAGQRHQYFLNHYRERVQVEFSQPGIELEGFVSDPRPAYERAAVVVAPLVASAGTNIKILEAMAMGKAIVSTPAGINGLDVEQDVMLAGSGAEMASAIAALLSDAEQRRSLECRARRTAELRYGWDAIAERQRELYESLRPKMA